MTTCKSLSYTSPYLNPYSSPLIASPLYLSTELSAELTTKCPELPDLHKIGLYELEKLAYTYQIEYTIPISESERPLLIKRFTEFFEQLDSINFNAIRAERQIQRSRCRNTHTFVAQNDVMLMEDNQLVFLEEGFPPYDIYALDRYRDVDRFWDNERNLFTGAPLTSDQLLCLSMALKDERYPLIEVDDLQQEVINLKALLHHIPPQQRYMEQLIKLAKEYKLPYEHIPEFVSNLNSQQYNDFLKHYSLRQKLGSPNQGAIDYIIHKINVIKNGPFITEIIWAIDDYMYMIRNKLSYDELKNVRKPHYRPYDSEITRIENGLETYDVDLNGQKLGSYERRNNEGVVVEKGMYKDDLKHGWFEYRDGGYLQTGFYCKNKRIGKWVLYHPNGMMARCGYYRDHVPHGVWSFYDMEGKLVKEGAYVKGKKDGVWEKEKTEYYLDGVLMLTFK